MQKQSELPEGWAWSEVNQLGFLINGDRGKNYPSKKDYVDDGIPFINAGHLINGKISIEKKNFITKEKYESLNSGKLIEGDIIYCLRGTLGKCALFSGMKTGAIASSLVILRLNEKINNIYIYYFLISPFGRKLIKIFDNGTAQPNLSAKSLSNYPVPLPPLTEQYRIVSAIEALFARLDVANKRLDRVPEILKKFKQSVLAAACDGRLTEEWRKEHLDIDNRNEYLQEINKIRAGCSKKDKIKFKTLSELNISNLSELPDFWLWIPSNLIFSYVTSGSRGWAKYYSDTGPMFIRIGNLNRNSIHLNLENIRRVSPPDNSEGKRTRIQQNDILISITADIGSIGYICEDIGDAYINQHIALARPIQNLNPKFIAFFLHSQTGGKKQFEKQHRGATKIGLGLDDIRSIAIPLPPLPEQHEIVRRVDALFSLVDSIEAKVAAARERTEKLRQSILAKAFSGELVPTEAELARLEGRDYEPADALLERIKAEQAKSEKKGKAAK